MADQDDWVTGRDDAQQGRPKRGAGGSYSAGYESLPRHESPPPGGPLQPLTGAFGGGLAALLVAVPLVVGLFFAGAWAIAILYPFSLVVALLTAVVITIGPALIVKPAPDWLLLVTGFFGLVGLVLTLRVSMHWDHRFARDTRYRRVRHVIRLMIVGALGVYVLVNWDRTRWTWTAPAIGYVETLRRAPWLALVVIAAVAAAHFILTRPTPIRGLWYKCLARMGMAA